MERLKPRALRPGDRIGVVAPSGPVRADRFEAGLAALSQLGFEVVIGLSVRLQRGYMAGPDEARLADLVHAWRDEAIAAIVCARGGYGVTRILPRFDFGLARRTPKLLVGFSDITALHLGLWRQAGLVSVHGPMVEADPQDPGTANFAALRAVLTSDRPLGEVRQPAGAPPLQTIVAGRTSGTLLGGNLTLVCGSLGTPWEVETDGAILLLEEVDEQPYAVDRMLHQLLAAGKLQRCAGFVFGESVGCEAGRGGGPSLTLREVLDDVFIPLGKPAIYGLAAGHGRHRLALPLGVRASLDATACRLVIEEAACV